MLGRLIPMFALRRSQIAILLASAYCLFRCLVIPAGHAQESNVIEELAEQVKPKGILPDLGRTELAQEGYTIEAYTVNDSWANTRGGNYRGVGVIGNLGLVLTVDTTKAGLWENGELVVYGLGIYGRQPSKAVGDFQYTSAIDAVQEVELYEAYYKHSFNDGGVTVLAGIHDFTLDFATIDYGFDFIQSSFYTPSTITQEPYSFYPYTGLGMNTSIQLTEEEYLKLGAYDGTPSNPVNPHAMKLTISKGGGIYSIAEVGRVVKGNAETLHSKIAGGTWYDSANYEDVNGVDRNNNWGSYIVGEQDLWREPGSTDQGFAVLGQVGQAVADRNFNPWYFGTALRYKGAIEGRDDDIVGVGYLHAQTSSRYRSLNEGTGTSERVAELSYRAVITPYLVLTPELMYVMDPYGDTSKTDALIAYIRSEIEL